MNSRRHSVGSRKEWSDDRRMRKMWPREFLRQKREAASERLRAAKGTRRRGMDRHLLAFNNNANIDETDSDDSDEEVVVFERSPIKIPTSTRPPKTYTTIDDYIPPVWQRTNPANLSPPVSMQPGRSFRDEIEAAHRSAQAIVDGIPRSKPQPSFISRCFGLPFNCLGSMCTRPLPPTREQESLCVDENDPFVVFDSDDESI